MNRKTNKPFALSGITVLLSVLFLSLLSTQQVHASCAAQPQDGSWVNSDPNTRGITRAELRFTCQDVVHNGQPHPPGPPWHIQLWGSCSPTDCAWGETGAEFTTIDGTKYIYGVYRQSFATRYVYVYMPPNRTDRLWIYIWTDFTSPNRSDYASQSWFVRE